MAKDLRRALRKLGAVRLRDLHGVSENDLRKILPSNGAGWQLFEQLDSLVAEAQDYIHPTYIHPTRTDKQQTKVGVSTAVPPPLETYPKDIFIPVALRGVPLPGTPLMSIRLHHILATNGFKTFGDIHGVKMSDILELPNCGRKTLLELANLVGSIQGSSVEALLSQQALSEARLTFSVSPGTRDLDPFSLPLSVRAKKALKARRIKTLGQLDGLHTSKLLEIANCGKKTVEELQSILRRASAGEFCASPEALQRLSPVELLPQIDDRLGQLSKRDQKILTLRLGGNGHPPQTLAKIGARFHMTRERVRQIVFIAIGNFSCRGGPKRKALFDKISAICQEKLLPLTPGLLLKWAAPAWSFRFKPELYVRAIHEMRPDIPAWLEGRPYRTKLDKRLQETTRAIKASLRLRPGTRPLPEAFAALRAMPGYGKVTPNAFLLALQASTRLHVHFPEPDRPEVSLKPRRPRRNPGRP